MTATKPTSLPRRTGVRGSTWITLIGLAGLLALLAWTSMTGSRIECEVCLTYNGIPTCATAAAADEETAVRAATDTACAPVTGSRASSLECSRIQPDRTGCK